MINSLVMGDQLNLWPFSPVYREGTDVPNFLSHLVFLLTSLRWFQYEYTKGTWAGGLVFHGLVGILRNG